MKLQFALFIVLAAALPALASDADFGLIGVTTVETARLNAYCDGSVTPVPCDVTFEFHDQNGRTLKQSSMILQPNTSAFVDFSPQGSGFLPVRVEFNPCFKVLRGTAQPSLEIFENFFARTRLLINWGDGAQPRSGEIEQGPLGVTQFDIVRMGATCEGDGSVEPASCNLTFEVHDASGGTLKSSRLLLAPGTSGFVDFRLSEIGSTVPRVLINPCFDVATGVAVLDIQTIDTFTNLTLTQSYPAALVPAVQ